MDGPQSQKNDNGTDAGFIAQTLKRHKERAEKFEAALFKVFPIDAYRRARPDVEEACEGNTNKIIEHFVEYGMDEMDMQKEGIRYGLELYQHVRTTASLLAAELDELKERESKLSAALEEVFPIELYAIIRPDVNTACDSDSKKILKHFIEYGINEVDMRWEMQDKTHKNFALRTTENCLRDICLTNSLCATEEPTKRKLSLLKTKGNPSNLRENRKHNFSIMHTMVHYKSNSVCTWIPKNGCSNLRYSIAEDNGVIKNIEEIQWIHQNNLSLNASTAEALQAEYTFVVLRNPFKRLLSFFLDKLCHYQEEDFMDMSYKHAQTIFNFNHEMSFKNFIDYIWDNPGTIYSDTHTSPQCEFLLYQKYDDYFALEKINHANQVIYEKTGMSIKDIREENSIFTSKGFEYCSEISCTTKASNIHQMLENRQKPIAENMYTNEMIKKVAYLYLQDILLYCKEIPNDKGELDYWIEKAIGQE